MKWHENILMEKKRELAASASSLLVFALMFSIWHFALGRSFAWREINPIEEPPLLPRLFYSAIVYGTLGAWLYHRKVYLRLWQFFVETLHDRRAYNSIKAIMWGGMTLIAYVLIKAVVDLMNAIISFSYNILNLTLYLLPPLGMAGIAFLICWLLMRGRDAVGPIVVSVADSNPSMPGPKRS